MKGFNLPRSRIDVNRSFTEAEWAHILRTAGELPVGPVRVRLGCLLELLVRSGIRLDELAKATWADFRREFMPDQPELGEVWVLSVVGKRSKQRDVPVADDVVALLQEHATYCDSLDRGAVIEAASGEGEGGAVQRPRALIRTLHPSVERWGRGKYDQLVKVTVTERAGEALSAGGIYAVLKRFFAKAARGAAPAGLDAERFKKASTHWMRHTFVRQALVDGVPIEVVTELVGHSSVDTTTIYSSQELARKARVIQSMRRRTA